MKFKLEINEKKDLIKYIKKEKIKFLSLSYVGVDSNLKSLTFVCNDLDYINLLLSSSVRIASVFLHEKISVQPALLFPSYERVFLNPFSTHPMVHILCKIKDKTHSLSPYAPDTILMKANEKLEETGIKVKVGGELEYYVLYNKDEMFFPTFKKQYHSTSPFTLYESMRNEALDLLSHLGIQVKYGHSESGKLMFTKNLVAEQHEVEFLPTPVLQAALDLVLGRWVICNLAQKYKVHTTFAPIIKYNSPGNGLHLHLELLKNTKNVVKTKKNSLSSYSFQAIAGLLRFSPSLCVFGNAHPLSYYRLASKKDTPSSISWGEESRKELIRIPLQDITPPTIEFRAPDGCAVIPLLLAGVLVALRYGLKMAKNSKKWTSRFYFQEKENQNLPQTHKKAIKELNKMRKYYEEEGVFPKETLDSIILDLNSYENLPLSSLINRYLFYFPFTFSSD